MQEVRKLKDGSTSIISVRTLKGRNAKKLAYLERDRLELECYTNQNKILLSDFVSDWITLETQQGRWKRTHKRYMTNASREFVSYIHRLGIRYLQDITYAMCLKWTIEANEHKKKRGYNKSVSFLKRLFNVAKSLDYLDKSPVDKLKKLSETDCETTRPIKKELLDRILSLTFEHKPELNPVIKLAMYTGMRRGEMCSLKWDDIDMTNKLIYIRGKTTKAGYDRIVPIHDMRCTLLFGQQTAFTKVDTMPCTIS